MSPHDLQQPVLISLLGGGFVAAFLHAALPTHWLPFVLVGRAQRWSLGRVMAVAVTAGLAHIASTALVGSLIVAAGLALNAWIGGLLPHLSAALLFVFGAFYLARASLQKPITATGPEADVPEPAVSDRGAFWGLVLMMAVTPGEVLLPIYLSSATEGVMALALLTLSFAAGTVLGMTLLAALASAGYSILRLERWARYEGAILGVALILIGLLVMTHQH
ncbi:hypothetical protein HNP32_001960 [Brevundimonas bullata]|uniref:Urease accessory protein UreH-like transmembrane domain-containing protein n=1 Tax=Brevundimonas bullata TaxID=13160 RepID=A0A7W7IPM3_9CAUL|nr:hypothetical protein [Brevundimonas bullata]MBB4798216.1 hypothetical protein [Brevundimonas bullata]MBB6383470.1 hypothetical protein [Brevundimonas bullata]